MHFFYNIRADITVYRCAYVMLIYILYFAARNHSSTFLVSSQKMFDFLLFVVHMFVYLTTFSKVLKKRENLYSRVIEKDGIDLPMR